VVERVMGELGADSGSERQSAAAQRALLPRKRRRRRPEMLRIGGRISSRSFVSIAAITFLVALGLWWLAADEGWQPPLFLPSPTSVWHTLEAQWNNGQLASDTGVSVYRITIGFLIASAVAIPIGVLMGTYRFWEAALEPLIDFIRYIPVIAFVPLTILWSGVGDTQKFVVIWIGTFFQQVLLIMDNTKRVPIDFVDIGRTLGLKDRKILKRIIIRSAAPGIWDSLRVSLGWAYTWLVVAELVAATSGLGYRITVGQRYLETNLIFAYMIVLGVIGLVLDQLMRGIGRLLFRYETRR
jgi:NitT/TauT family transport system permease protein